jgi:carboxypeptidase PM20D1|tara:strand:- start:147 stop:1643 length:1497 start_codon:yes stop_codon:yes gene_type:complete
MASIRERPIQIEDLMILQKKRTAKRLGLIFGLTFIAFLVVLLFNTLRYKSLQKHYEAIPAIKIPDLAVHRFQSGIRYRTISFGDGRLPNKEVFSGFLDHIKNSFPLVDSLLIKRTMGDYTLLFEWKGLSEESPGLIYAHYDVVPIDSLSLSAWKSPPFAGTIVDESIYGRGTLDNKVDVFAILEAMEMLLSQGFQPKNTLYFGFGHDEEIGGKEGAAQIANYFKEQGIRLSFSLDEGAPLLDGEMMGLNQPLALISIAEKGYVSYQLTINTEGGHSSTPTKNNTIASLARAIIRLEENQFDYLMQPVRDQLRYLGAEMSFFKRMIFANAWLTQNLILKKLNAHTTTVATLIQGGFKDNVIPTTASVTVNFRIMPGQTIQNVHDHVVKVIDDSRITLSILQGGGQEPSPVASVHTEAYTIIEKSIKQVFGEVIVSPFLLPGGTDSKHFVEVTDHCYRLNAAQITNIEAAGFHGLNEHITVISFQNAIRFYHQLIQNING